MCLGRGAWSLGLNIVSISLEKLEQVTLTSVCQVSVWYDNVVSIVVVDLAVLGVRILIPCQYEFFSRILEYSRPALASPGHPVP